MDIEGDQGMDDENFDREMLEADIKVYRELLAKVESVFTQIEDDEGQMGTEEGIPLREEFNSLKAQIGAQPLYDKELTIKIQTIEWLYSASDMLNNK